jgi:hypothetical protein
MRTPPIAVRNCRNSAPAGNLPRAVRRGYHNSSSDIHLKGLAWTETGPENRFRYCNMRFWTRGSMRVAAGESCLTPRWSSAACSAAGPGSRTCCGLLTPTPRTTCATGGSGGTTGAPTTCTAHSMSWRPADDGRGRHCAVRRADGRRVAARGRRGAEIIWVAPR